MTGILVKRGNLDTNTHAQTCMHTHAHTHTRRFLDKEDRYQGDASVCHGMPKVARTPPETRREPWNGVTFTPSQTFEESVLLLSRSQMCNLQNCETMNVLV